MAEGLAGVVYPDDPAYNLCDRISGKGYNSIHLNFDTMVSGKVEPPFTIIDTGKVTVLGIASAIAQMSHVATEEPCAHFWVVSSPDGDWTWQYCKMCGAIRRQREVIYEDVNEYDNWNSGSRFRKKPESFMTQEEAEEKKREGWFYEYRG